MNGPPGNPTPAPRPAIPVAIVVALGATIASGLGLVALRVLPPGPDVPAAIGVAGMGLFFTGWWAARAWTDPLDAALESTLFDQMDDGVVIVDERGAPVLLNPPARTIFPGAEAGRVDAWAERYDIRGHDGLTPCSAESFPLERARTGAAVPEVELLISAEGSIPTWIRGSARPLTDARGRQRGGLFVFRDVTTAKRAQAALEEERARRERALSRGEAVGRLDVERHEPRELELLCARAEALVTEVVSAEWCWLELTDPELRRLGLDTHALSPCPGRFPATAWITGHRRPLAVADVADDPFGSPDDLEAMGVRAYAGVPLVDGETVLGVLYAGYRTPRGVNQEDLELLRRVADRVATAATKVSLYERLRSLNASLTQRGEELAAQEQRFRTLAEAAPVLIWVTDADGRLDYVNRTWREMLGTPEADADPWPRLLPDADRDLFLAALARAARGEAGFRLEHRLIRPTDGAERWVLHTGAPKLAPNGACLGVIGTCLDITERKAIEAERAAQRNRLEELFAERTQQLAATHARLRVADRLAAIGTLTAGLGHDMNNVLFPVRCRLDALDWNAVPTGQRSLLESVRHAVDYLQQLTDGLRHFALDPDDDRPPVQTVHLPDWWSSIQPLLARAVPKNVSLRAEIGQDLPPVRVTPHRLTQSALNLLVNAGEAMPDGGTVTVRLHAPDAQQVLLEVADEGTGMTDEVRAQMFDPFFTTKTRRLSTGLGLSLVHGFVQASGGTIEVDSSPDRGTCFRLALPAAQSDPVSEPGGRGSAALTVRDPRVAAWLSGLLTSADFAVTRRDAPEAEDVLWVTDACPEHVETAREFLEDRPGGRILAVGPRAPEWDGVRAVLVEPESGLDDMHAAIRAVATNGGGA